MIVIEETFESRGAAEGLWTHPATKAAMEADGIDMESVRIEYLDEVGTSTHQVARRALMAQVSWFRSVLSGERLRMADVPRQAARIARRAHRRGGRSKERRSWRPLLEPLKTHAQDGGYLWWLLERDYYGFPLGTQVRTRASRSG